MTKGEYVATILSILTDRVYLYPGGTIAPIYEALDCQAVCCKSEQGAGFAAAAEGELSDKPSVVLVSSGPGVTNLVTVIADAYFDHTPMVCVCGQSSKRTTRPGVRQIGFQEVDTLSIVSKISVYSAELSSESDIFNSLISAFSAAGLAKGPAVLSIPINVQRETVTL